jgi:large subunit ribosomal protein L11
VLLKKACGLKTAAANSKKEKVATIKRSEVQKIAELKMPDLTAGSLDAAISMISGTARSMGITVVD